MRDLSARRTLIHSQPREALLQPLPNENYLSQTPADSRRRAWFWLRESISPALVAEWGEGKAILSFSLTSLLSGADPVRSSPASPPWVGERRWSSFWRVSNQQCFRAGRIPPGPLSAYWEWGCEQLLTQSCSHPCIPPLNMRIEALPEQQLHTAAGRMTRKDDTSLHHRCKGWLARTHAYSGLPVTSTEHPRKAEGCSTDTRFRCMVRSQRRPKNQQSILTYCNRSSWVSDVKHWSLLKANSKEKQGTVCHAKLPGWTLSGATQEDAPLRPPENLLSPYNSIGGGEKSKLHTA